jgi:hypothetical protein
MDSLKYKYSLSSFSQFLFVWPRLLNILPFFWTNIVKPRIEHAVVKKGLEILCVILEDFIGAL